MFSAYVKPPEQAFFSNSKSFVEQQQYIFDTLWEKAIPARIKIRQIELANEQEFTRSISCKEVRDILMDLIECSVKSFLIFLPGDEVVKWINEQCVFEGLHAATLRGVEVRIIMDQTAGKGYFEEWFKRFSIQFLLSSVQNAHLDIIVDYKFTVEGSNEAVIVFLINDQNELTRQGKEIFKSLMMIEDATKIYYRLSSVDILEGVGEEEIFKLIDRMKFNKGLKQLIIQCRSVFNIGQT
jgi:hypothetical protein